MLIRLCVCLFDLLSNHHDQKEYDNHFVINRETNIYATLKIKIEIIYSLDNPCGVPSTKKKKKEQRSFNSVTIIPHKATRG